MHAGWTFDGASGECKSQPQALPEAAPTALSSRRSCATAFATHLCQGMLFVLPAADDGLPPPPLPEPLPICEPGSGYQSTDVIRELPYDYCTLLENVLDVGHLPYTHHISVSNRKNGGPLGLALTTPVAFGGFAGVWAQGPRKGALGPQTTVFRAPSLMWHSIESKAISSATVVYATPVAPGRSLIFARFPFKARNTPRLGVHSGGVVAAPAACPS